MAIAPRLLLIAAFAALALRGSGQDISLYDALDDTTLKPPPKPSKNPTQSIDLDFDFDMFDRTTKVPKTTTTKAPPKKTPDLDFDFDMFDRTTKVPKTTTTKAPPKKTPVPKVTQRPKPITKAPKAPHPPTKSGPDDFDLLDALVEPDDKKGGGGGGSDGEKDNVPGRSDNSKPNQGRGFSDKDLEDAVSGGYKPDKTRDGNDSPSDQGNNGSLEQTGTIAGIASALAMALIGAVSSYISYQQKKFCFSIQEGLNAEYAKGQTMEGVAVAIEEPQVQQTLLKSESAEPPTADNTKI
ncbi:CD99 antigen-like protein 2 [Protopterus annectens]|uniref:CD99 antigen-like protein 2 n=1 Tax=Protopterus annectens TaxID=7888 RepID=UPI001CFA4FB9|nr:CD99 antigen-like protein 2 [Protopterus annectens]